MTTTSIAHFLPSMLLLLLPIASIRTHIKLTIVVVVSFTCAIDLCVCVLRAQSHGNQQMNKKNLSTHSNLLCHLHKSLPYIPHLALLLFLCVSAAILILEAKITTARCVRQLTLPTKYRCNFYFYYFYFYLYYCCCCCSHTCPAPLAFC